MNTYNLDMKIIKIKNDQEIILRGLKMSDAQALMNFFNSLIDEGAPILTNRKTTLRQEKKIIKDLLIKEKRGESKSILAEKNSQTDGLISLKREPFRKKHTAELGIAVRKENRNSGLGLALLVEIINQARNMPGVEIVQLEVSQNNLPAIHLYEKAGFKNIARIPKAFKYKGKNEDLFIYQYSLEKVRS